MNETLSQDAQLDYAVNELRSNLIAWGIDDYLGYRMPSSQVLRLSVSGATNLVALVNTLNVEIDRLNAIVANDE